MMLLVEELSVVKIKSLLKIMDIYKKEKKKKKKLKLINRVFFLLLHSITNQH